MSFAVLGIPVHQSQTEQTMLAQSLRGNLRIISILVFVIALHGVVLLALMLSKASVKPIPAVKTIAVRLVSLTPDQPKPLPPKPIVEPKVVPVVKEQPKSKPLPILVAPKAAMTPIAVAPVAKPIEKPTPIAEPQAVQPPATAVVPQKAEPAPPKIVQGVEYLVQPKVVYPESARLSGDTGTTVVNALINVNGTVDEVKIKHSSGSAILDKEALRAVKKALFKPHRENGVAIAVIAPVRIDFDLDGESL